MTSIGLSRRLWKATQLTGLPSVGLVAGTLAYLGLARQWSANLGRDDALLSLAMLVAGAGAGFGAATIARWPGSFGFGEVLRAIPNGVRRSRHALVQVVIVNAGIILILAFLAVQLLRLTGAVGQPDLWELLNGAAAATTVGLLILILAEVAHSDRLFVVLASMVVALQIVPYVIGVGSGMSWLAPWVPVSLRGTQPSPEIVYRPMVLHTVYLVLAAAALTLGLAGRGWWQRGVAVGLGVLTVAAGVTLTTTSIPPGEATRRVAAAAGAANRTGESCSRRDVAGSSLELCLLPSYERWRQPIEDLMFGAVVASARFGSRGTVSAVQILMPALGPDLKNPDWFNSRVVQAGAGLGADVITFSTDIGESGIDPEFDDQMRSRTVASLFRLPTSPAQYFDAQLNATVFGVCDASALPDAPAALAALALASPRFESLLNSVADQDAAREASFAFTGVTFDVDAYRQARVMLSQPEPPTEGASLVQPGQVPTPPCPIR